MKTARLHSVPPLREAREPSPASAYPTLRVDPGICDGVGIWIMQKSAPRS